jgi:hypothetical protein
VRDNALTAAYAIWKLDRQSRFVEECCRVATQDIDEVPKGTAVVILKRVFESSKDCMVQRSLARIVLDANATNGLRNRAYSAMVAVEHGLSTNELIRETDQLLEDVEELMSRRPVKLCDIDWTFVLSKIKTNS